MATDVSENARPARLHPAWYVAIVLALAGNVYFIFAAHQIANRVDQVNQAVAAENAKISSKIDANATAAADHQRRLEALAEQAQQSALALDQYRAQTARTSSKMAASLGAKLAQQQQQVAGQLADLRDATSNADSKITQVNTDVTTVKTDVANTQTELDKTSSDLKRAIGDMGVMSGLVATNSSGLTQLRTLGERNYFEFDIKKTAAPIKVGDISIALRKTDSKRSRFTLTVFADDKTVEKRDRTINEPVQLYVAGNRQPDEIVVNKVTKDEVIGYLATPKVKLARR